MKIILANGKINSDKNLNSKKLNQKNENVKCCLRKQVS